MNLPSLGNKIPKRGGKFSGQVGYFLLRLFGWKIIGKIPNEKKFIIIVAPHSSNWDFIIGTFGMFALNIRVSFFIKHTVFKKPFDRIISWLGGFPINRSSSHGVVEQIVTTFKKQEKLVLVITPEGTRSKVKKWKTGFYLIAQRANIPIMMAYFDNQHKKIGFGPIYHCTGNMEEDIKGMQNYYSQFKRRDELKQPTKLPY